MGLARFIWKVATFPVRLVWRLAFGTAAERQGRRAELEVKAFLEGRGIPCLHDVYVRHGNGVWTQIDLLANLGDAVCSVEVKSHRGKVSVDADAASWEVEYMGGRREKMSNPIRQNAGHLKALGGFLGKAGRRAPLSGAVVFTDAELSTGMFGLGRLPECVFRGMPDLRPGIAREDVSKAWEALSDHDASMDKDSVRKEHLAGVKRLRKGGFGPR